MHWLRHRVQAVEEAMLANAVDMVVLGPGLRYQVCSKSLIHCGNPREWETPADAIDLRVGGIC